MTIDLDANSETAWVTLPKDHCIVPEGLQVLRNQPRYQWRCAQCSTERSEELVCVNTVCDACEKCGTTMPRPSLKLVQVQQ